MNLGDLPGTKERTETCPGHGKYQAKNFLGSIWTKCPKCTEEKDDADKAAAERAAMQAKADAWKKAIGGAGIPLRFQDRTIDGFIAKTDAQEKAKSFALEFVRDFASGAAVTGRSALFVGTPGTGKTHIACAIGMALVREKRTVLFTTMLRAMRRIKDTWRKESAETEESAVNALSDVDLLILDEVGIQFGTDAEKMLVFDVLNARYENRRPTILLSNLDVQGVKGYLGERVFDRLREDGGQVVVFNWESHRGAA